MTRIKDLLPIGSVIRLKNGTKSVIIMGIMQKELRTGETYDYLVVPFPEGYLSKETVFYAMHENIEEIISEGYSNKEREKFISKLEKYYEEK